MADLLTIGTAAATGVPLTALGVRRTTAAIEARRLRAFRLSFPYGTEPAQVVAFCRSVSGLLPPWWKRLFGSPSLVVEIWAGHEGVTHRLLVSADVAGFLLAQLRAVLPGVRIEVEDDAPAPDLGVAAELRLSNFRWPLRSDNPISIAAGIIATTQPLTAGEGIVIQWVLSPAPTPRRAALAPTLLAELGLPSVRVQASLPLGEAAAQREKTAEPAVWAVCRIGAEAPTRERARHLIRQVEGAFHPTSAPGASLRRRWVPEVIAARRLRRRAVPLLSWPMLLNAKEMAAVSGLPMGNVTLAGLELAGTRQLPPAPSVPRRGRVIGRASSPGNERSVALSVTESLKHLHVIGPTGVGKSTLLLNLIVGDMAAGRGVVVVDPKGDLAERLFANDSLPSREVVVSRRVHVTEARVAELTERLSPTEQAIIETLDRVRLGSALQLEALHFTGHGAPATLARRARRTLARLVGLRILARLERRVGGVRAGSAGFVYALDVAGQRVASACGPAGGRRIRRPWTPAVPFVAHALAVTDLYVGLHRSAAAEEIQLLAFDAEPLCWRTFTGLGGGQARLKPDAFVRIAAGDHEHFSFVEVDRATHSAPALGRKLAVYRRYLASGREQARFGLFPRVVIAVPDEARKRVATEVCADQPADTWPLWHVVLAADAVAALSGGGT